MNSTAFLGLPFSAVNGVQLKFNSQLTTCTPMMRLRPSSGRRAYNPDFDRSIRTNDSTDTNQDKIYSENGASNGVHDSNQQVYLDHDDGNIGSNGIGNNNNNNNNHHNNGWSNEDNDEDHNMTNTDIGTKSHQNVTESNISSNGANGTHTAAKAAAVTVVSHPNILVRNWPGLRDRLAANPRLPIQLGVEISVGVVTKTLAEVQGRGERFWKEFDFYLSDLALEIIGDAMLVWLLSPMAINAAAKTGWLAKLPKHAGQIGNFGLGQRLTTFVYKGLQFGTVGFASSMVGHGATTWMVKQRRAKNGHVEGEESVELAPVVPTSLVWGAFMLTSSNVRYQTVNALEQRLIDPLFGKNAALLTAATFGIRFSNCFLGGVQWLPFAKTFGIQ